MDKTEGPGLQKSAPQPDRQNAARERVRKTLREMAKAHWEANPLIVEQRPMDTVRETSDEEHNG